VSDDRHIVLDVWIAIEELVALAQDQNAANQKDDHCESERHPQRPACSITAINGVAW
jgi:hypothetical protein